MVETTRFLGTYQTLDMQRPQAFTKDTNLRGKTNDEVIFRGNFSLKNKTGELLFFKIHYLNVMIKKNGIKLYSFGTESDKPTIVKSGGMTWGHIFLKDIKQSDELEIIVQNPYKKINFSSIYMDFIKSFCVGNSKALFLSTAKKNASNLVIGSMMLILGSFMFIIGSLFSLRESIVLKPVLWGAIYTIVSGVWFLFQTDTAGFIFLHPVFNLIICTLCIFLQIPILTAYLLFFMKTSARRFIQRIQRISMIFVFLFMIGQTVGWFDAYEIREYYFYIAGVFLIVCTCSMLYEIKRNNDKTDKIVMYSLLIFEVFGEIEIINYRFELLKVMMSLSIGYIIFITIQCIISIDYIKQILLRAKNTVEMEKELLENNIAIVLSQIHPHFLYNSISSIQMLCRKDPLRAELALAEFADFLRGNMDSLKSSKSIAFEKELQHVKAYLYLEKVRFGDLLHVDYDIQVKDFLIPPLTIQPLVENASKHGVGEKETGGTICIKTREDRDNIEVTIEDDGVGFDTEVICKEENGENHIGLQNVKEHIERQCGGSMRIISQVGVGTQITIKIPKQEALL
ncbi:MAG: histidine kinase [Velocimicrobium sp.]